MGLSCFKARDIRGKLGDGFNLRAFNTETLLCLNIEARGDVELVDARVPELAERIGKF